MLNALIRPLWDRRTWLATLHLLLDFPLGVFWFCVLLIGLVLGAGMLITLVGLPILTVTFLLARAAAELDRSRFALAGEEIPAPVRRAGPPRGGVLGRFFAPLVDLATWKELLWALLVQPVLGLVGFLVVLFVWGVGVAAVIRPLVRWTFHSDSIHIESAGHDSWWVVALTTLAGIVLVLAAPWVVRALFAVEVRIARLLLGPGRQDALEERVERLSETRAGSVESALADRRQIERDLHDGAQQRLVALGVDLGLALERIDEDPAAAKELVGNAHREAQQAIVELRDLARGIHPAVLTDRGLDAALSALAARSAVPVHLEVDLPRRPPASVEATAYFVAAEALTNAARHAGAGSIALRVGYAEGGLRLEVEDDGPGGAEIVPGGGLAGLAARVAAVDGSLDLSSPPGGPTTLRVELPCGS